MPYKNIVFIKLEKRLLNDHRWYMMSEMAQLIYIKMILLAAETYNKIPQNDLILKEALRSRLDLKEFEKCLKEIKENFPKFRSNKHFRYFSEFETKTNYIPSKETPRKARGLPKEGVYKEEEEEEDKEYVGVVRNQFYLKYKEVFNKDYVASFGKDGRIFKDLLKIIPQAELISLIDKFFKSTDKFIQDSGYTVGVFKTQINKLQIQKPKVKYG